MAEYLHGHSLVLAALLAGIALFLTLLAGNFLSLRFLRAVRKDAPQFWASKFANVPIGLARLYSITSATVDRIGGHDPIVHEICTRYWRPWRAIILLARTLFAATFVLLVASGHESIHTITDVAFLGLFVLAGLVTVFAIR